MAGCSEAPNTKRRRVNPTCDHESLSYTDSGCKECVQTPETLPSSEKQTSNGDRQPTSTKKQCCGTPPSDLPPKMNLSELEQQQIAETGHLPYLHDRNLIEWANGEDWKQMKAHFAKYPADVARLVTGDDVSRQFILRNLATLNNPKSLKALLEIPAVKDCLLLHFALCQKVEGNLTVFLLALRLQRQGIIELLLPFILRFDVRSLPVLSTSRARVKTARDPLDGKSLLEAALQMQTSVQILQYLIDVHDLTAEMVKTTESVQMAIKYRVQVKILRLLRNCGAPYSDEYLKIASMQFYPSHKYLVFFLKWKKEVSESPAPLRNELCLLGPIIERHNIGGFKAKYDLANLILELKRLVDLGLRFDPEADKELIEKNDMAKEVSCYIATIDKVGK